MFALWSSPNHITIKSSTKELSFNSSWLLVGSWLFCIQSWSRWRVEQGTFTISVHWGPQFGMPTGAKMSLAPMNPYRMLFIQTFTPIPSIPKKLCMQNKQLREKKTSLESKDIISNLFSLVVHTWRLSLNEEQPIWVHCGPTSSVGKPKMRWILTEHI